MFKLRTDNAFGFESQSVAIKPERPFQVINTDRDERNPRLHVETLLATLEAARATLGGALSLAKTLPDALSSTVVIVSRRAFMEAVRAAALVSAVMSLLAAVGTVRFLRGTPQKLGAIQS
jgi:hypothetical protein